MPDWTYQTVFRPVLSRLSYPTAQRLVFGALGRLATFAPGRTVIRLMGHAAPPEAVSSQISDWSLISPVALSCGIDQECQATSGLSLFGFGLIELGPIHVDSQATPRLKTTANTNANPTGNSAAERAADWLKRGCSIRLDQSQPVTPTRLCQQLRRSPYRGDVIAIARIVSELPDVNESDLEQQLSLPIRDLISTCCSLADRVDGFSLFVSIKQNPRLTLQVMRRIVGELSRSQPNHFWLMSVPQTLTADELAQLMDSAANSGRFGILFADDISGQSSASTNHERNPRWSQTIRALRDGIASFGQKAPLIAMRSQAVDPAAALALKLSGVDLIFIDQGLIEAGPGLPKRINAAIHAHATAEALTGAMQGKTHANAVSRTAVPVVHQSWFWTLLLSIGLLVGGSMAFVLGLGRVLLPYDEEFLGMLREEICSINDQLLPFMSHDRVTLAGTMLALGTLYSAFSWYGERHGLHWARVAILSSAFVGFLSFFLFLGFGYFDPFHAFVTCIMFQFLTISVRSRLSDQTQVEFDLHNTPGRLRALWGQLLLVLHGAGVMFAGIVICTFGVTNVFVVDDLTFMQTTAEALWTANPRLVPLVAHDRASFGGMLISLGMTLLLSAMWGWQRGRRWLWIAMALSGTIGYGSTIAIHWHVGYTSLRHLIPAYAGLTSLWLALLLSSSWMFEDASTAAVLNAETQ